jgi:hypothetical protein
VIASQNIQTSEGNNTTSQPGLDNESNGNTNTVGDQTAVNGNNFQQSNEQAITQIQKSAATPRPTLIGLPG